MTELTFAELTALMGINGLTINDRYLITDKNWTIIAIATNAYRIVVPIVTEVTKAELDAFVAANGLNEGLQYKVTDKNWLLIAISAATLSPITGVLFMDNTAKPAYIITDVILKDTGVIIVDDLEIINETGYIPVSAYLDNLVNSGEEFNVTVAGSLFLQINPAENYKAYLIPIVSNGIPNYVGQILVNYVNNESPGYRLIVKFEKSPL